MVTAPFPVFGQMTMRIAPQVFRLASFIVKVLAPALGISSSFFSFFQVPPSLSTSAADPARLLPEAFSLELMLSLNRGALGVLFSPFAPPCVLSFNSIFAGATFRDGARRT